MDDCDADADESPDDNDSLELEDEGEAEEGDESSLPSFPLFSLLICFRLSLKRALTSVET